MTIDLGSSCIDRLSGTSGPITVVDKNNSANATGLIFSVCIFSSSTMTNIEVAAFTASGDDLTTRGYVSLANQGGAGLTTYTAPTDFSPFEIRSGDYIGISFEGTLRMALSGAGVWDLAGDNIPCTSEAFTSKVDRTISLYATGYQLGQLNIGDAWKTIQNIQINVGDSWKQLCDMEINIGDVWKKGVY